jgi:hypothetical protein
LPRARDDFSRDRPHRIPPLIEVLAVALAYKYWREDEPAEVWKPRWDAYRQKLAGIDFRGVPDLPKWFGYDLFNDGKFERFEYDARTSTLTLEMENWTVMNEVLDAREGQGPYRGDRSHRCEDFFYTCTFSRVAHFAYDRPLTMTLHEDEDRPRLSRWQCQDDYQRGEIQESDLVRELRAYYGIPLFHLAIETGNDGHIDIVFSHVKVRKSNSVPLSDYLGGKSPRLKCFYRWKSGSPDANRPD